MRYYIDTEFNGWGGELISMALVREDGRSLYFVLPFTEADLDPWVLEHVIPVIKDSPEQPQQVTAAQAPHLVADFLGKDGSPIVIIADWVADVALFCAMMNSGAMWWDQDGGCLQPIPSFSIRVERVDAYPCVLQEAVQHNAWWDAVALRAKLQGDD